MKFADRVAHQYQIAGGKVSLRIGTELPENLDGVGLFRSGLEYTGIGRISTGLGCPHAETTPDFLGLRLAFLAPDGVRVDFLAINDPAAPTDTHGEFMRLLAGTAEAAGSEIVASEATLGLSLVRSLGPARGAQIIGHVTKQTVRTALSSTAYQSYWTGIVEAGGVLGKCVLAPTRDENQLRGLAAGPHHLTEEWRERQGRGPVEFDLYWLPFIDEQTTSLLELTRYGKNIDASSGALPFQGLILEVTRLFYGRHSPPRWALIPETGFATVITASRNRRPNSVSLAGLPTERARKSGQHCQSLITLRCSQVALSATN